MNDKGLREISLAFPGSRVLVVGDVMLDEYIWGDVERISQEAPVPVVDIRTRSYAPGGAANVASNVVSLGGRVLLGGIVGRDDRACQLIDALSQCGVGAEGLVVDHRRPTTTKTRVIAHNQQALRLDREVRTPISHELEELLLDWVHVHLGTIDTMLVSDYAKGVITCELAEQVIRRARGADKPVIVDPKGQDYRKYRGATVVVPNTREARLALGHHFDHSDDIPALGEGLLRLLHGSAILITRGHEGASLFQLNHRTVHIPAVTRQVYDVTGAGDTVVATMALALGVGANLEQAARLANAAAGIVVGKMGTATVELEELAAALADSEG